MKKFLTIILILLLSICIAFLSFGYKNEIKPHTYYQVYLNEEVLGVIKSKNELEKYIDSQNDKYKEDFNVDTVYAPKGLVMKKIDTYYGETQSIKNIYKMISKKEPFTIQGFQFSIKKEDEVTTVYTLTEEIFEEAVSNTIKTFIGEEVYKEYEEKTQTSIDTVGSLIENIYIDENITVKKTNISVTEAIYTRASELSKYLLFGTTEKQNDYTVEIGDTIEDVAFNNKISVDEFLISNPNFTSKNNLLFPGQVVTIGITNPKVSVVMEEFLVKDQTVNYQTEYQYSDTKVIGDNEVIQVGQNGLERISQRIKYVNGEIIIVNPVGSKEQLEPTISQIILKGDKYESKIGSVKNWHWPTNSGYTISSGYVYRINPITGYRELHAAIDIAGTGTGSPIYASTNGVVSESGYRYQDGNYVCINHNVANLYTCYGHMVRRNVVVGQTVARGSVIGYIGMTGWATGPHLHFEVWIGKPWYGGYRINPFTMYN